MMAKYTSSASIDKSKLPSFKTHVDQLKNLAEKKARETDINNVIVENDPTATPLPKKDLLDSKLIPQEFKDSFAK